ncbi:MAG: DUF2971 domain-containing protein [Faecalicoccus sp.]|nr:DUF2971 domain-containing protein [Faecalicoccus sp.]
MKSEEYNNYKETFRNALNPKRRENIFEIAENELKPQVGRFPKSFFRYREINKYTDQEILNGIVHLSSPDKFDDIFDSKCYIDEDGLGDIVMTNYMNSKAIAKNIPGMQDVVVGHEKYFESVNKKIDNLLRIACFTQKNDNIPMWYYYANKHKGICIEYDIRTQNTYSELGYIFLPVIYPNKNESNNYYTGEFVDATFSISAVRNSLVKGNDWKFEKEWRIIKIQEEPDNDLNITLPVKGVYFGCDISPKDKNDLIELVKPMEQDVPLYEMKQSVTGLKAFKIK